MFGVASGGMEGGAVIGEGRGLQLSGGRAGLGRWGEFIVSGAESARVETVSGAALDIGEQSARDITNAVRRLDEACGLFLLIPRTGDSIVAFDLGADQSWEVDWLIRHEDEDFRWVSVRPTPADDVLVLYERGLVCIGAGGRARWQVLHDNPSAGSTASGMTMWRSGRSSRNWLGGSAGTPSQPATSWLKPLHHRQRLLLLQRPLRRRSRHQPVRWHPGHLRVHRLRPERR